MFASCSMFLIIALQIIGLSVLIVCLGRPELSAETKSSFFTKTRNGRDEAVRDASTVIILTMKRIRECAILIAATVVPESVYLSWHGLCAAVHKGRAVKSAAARQPSG